MFGPPPNVSRDGGTDVFVPVDAGVDAPPCDPNAEFGDPEALSPVLNTSADEEGCFISTIEGAIYFVRRNAMHGPDRASGLQIYRSAISSDGGFGTPEWLANVNEPDAADPGDLHPAVSPDGLRLYFYSYRTGPGFGEPRLSERTSLSAPWSPSVLPNALVPPGPPPFGDVFPIPGAIYCARDLTIYRANVDKTGYIFPPVDIDPDGGLGINHQSAWAVAPVVTPDELHLYFVSERTGRWLIYETRRTSSSEPWSPPVALPPAINASVTNFASYVTPDNCTLYYAAQAGNNTDMFRVTRGK